MGLRQGVFTGFYAPEEMKKQLQRAAKAEHRTLSGEIVHRLEESLNRDAAEQVEQVERRDTQ